MTHTTLARQELKKIMQLLIHRRLGTFTTSEIEHNVGFGCEYHLRYLNKIKAIESTSGIGYGLFSEVHWLFNWKIKYPNPNINLLTNIDYHPVRERTVIKKRRGDNLIMRRHCEKT